MKQLVGAKRAKEVSKLVASNTKLVRQRVETQIERAWHRLSEAMTSEDARRRITRLFESAPSFQFHEAAECPACGERGTLLGDDVYDSKVLWSEHYEEESPDEEVFVHTDYFVCENCGLRLDDIDLIESAGLSDSITAIRNWEPDYDDYGND